MSVSILLGVGTAAVVAMLCLSLWPDVVIPVPKGGERGRRRGAALEKYAWFRVFEGLIRGIATHFSGATFWGIGPRIEKGLVEAGRPLGLDSREFVASALLCAGGASLLGILASIGVGKSAGLGFFLGGVLGGLLPWLKLDEIAARRRVLVARGLPYAVDLAALSLEAGLDFAGAIGQVIAHLDGANPLRFEFAQMLRKISLGSSRQDAMLEFASRLDIVSVRQFVNSVIQAEKRGTPLAEVLSTQATVMRSKRSQAAEQTAARAGVLILGPLMLIFACVFIVLLGPFVIKFIRGEMF